MTLFVLTANRLSDGISVWYHSDGAWSENLAGSEIARDTHAAAILEAIGKKAYSENLVVDVNLIDVEETAGGAVRPLRLRERIRAFGPTVEYTLANGQQRPARASA